MLYILARSNVKQRKIYNCMAEAVAVLLRYSNWYRWSFNGQRTTLHYKQVKNLAGDGLKNIYQQFILYLEISRMVGFSPGLLFCLINVLTRVKIEGPRN